MHDRKEVLGEGLLRRGVDVVENHESAVVLVEDPLDEFEAEAAEAVSVGNAHLSYSAFKDSFQKGAQTLSLEVDAGTDIGDDLIVWVVPAHFVCLPFEVVPLLGRGDAAVADSLPVVGWSVLVLSCSIVRLGCLLVETDG